MATTHLEFNLPIYFASDGEAPKKGAFFAVNNKWNLSKIAKAVYNDSSAWKVLNTSPWNMSNLVYRADSTDCSSARRESSWALLTMSPNVTSKSSFIALCPRDARQVLSAPPRVFTYPVIWIPDLENMPLPVKRGEEPPTQPIKVIDRASIVIPGGPTTPGGGGGSNTGGDGGSFNPNRTKPAAQEAGMSPWMLVGLGVLMLGGLLFWPTTKSRKKGRKR